MLKCRGLLRPLSVAAGRARLSTGPSGINLDELNALIAAKIAEKGGPVAELQQSVKVLQDDFRNLRDDFRNFRDEMSDDRRAWAVPYIRGVAGDCALFVSGDPLKSVEDPYTFRSGKHDHIVREVARKVNRSVWAVKETLDRVISRNNGIHCGDATELMETVEFCRRVLRRTDNIKSGLKDQIFVLDNIEDFLQVRDA